MRHCTIKISGIFMIILSLLLSCKQLPEKKEIAKNVKIEFRLATYEEKEDYIEETFNDRKIYLAPKVEITKKDISYAIKDKTNVDYIINLHMNEQGTKKFAALTENNVGNKLAIMINGKILLAPMINIKIPGGIIQITGNFTKEEIDKLFKTLTEG